MKVQDLIRVLSDCPLNAEVRVGDQIESGPYLHQQVGGVWTDANEGGVVSKVILCADDNDLWHEEGLAPPVPELPLIWKPPS